MQLNDLLDLVGVAADPPVPPAGQSGLHYRTDLGVVRYYDHVSAEWTTIPDPNDGAAWDDITGKPATFPPSAHTHPIAEVTALQAALDAKASAADLAAHAGDTTDVHGIPDTALLETTAGAQAKANAAQAAAEGTADAALDAHVAALDPHPQYLTAAEIGGAQEHPWLVDVDPMMTAISHINWDTLVIDSAAVKNATKDSSGAQNDEINFDVVLGAGTWTIELMHRTSNDRGVYSVQLDGVAVGTVEGYAALSSSPVVESSTSKVADAVASTTVDIPAGTVAGNLLVMYVGVSDGGFNQVRLSSIPAGWTQKRLMTDNLFYVLYALYRVADGSEGANVTLNFTHSTSVVASCHRVSGFDSASPFEDDQSSYKNNVFNTNGQLPSVTVATLGALELAGVMAHGSMGSAANTWTPPAGFTELTDVLTHTADNQTKLHLEAAYIARAATGATGTKNATRSANSTYSEGISLLIKPDPAVVVAQRNKRSSIAGVVVAASGKVRLKLKMATKNGLSSGYKGSLQGIQLRRTA